MRVDSNAERLLSGLRLRTAAWVALGACGLLLAPHRSLAGEKIKITGNTNAVVLPTDSNKEIIAPGDFLSPRISGGESVQGPPIPAPNSPNMARNPKLDEYLDRKQNWIYESPKEWDRDKLVKEIYGVKEFTFAGTDRKSKTLMEQYFETGNPKKDGFSANRSKDPNAKRDPQTSSNEFDSGEPLSPRDTLTQREPLGIIPALNPAVLFNWNMSPDALSQVAAGPNGNWLLPSALGEAPFSQKLSSTPAGGNNPAQPSGDRLWDIRPKSFNRLTDPINSEADGTRSIMNPIAARKASVPLPETSQGRGGDPYALGNNGPVPPRSDVFTPAPIGPSAVPMFSPPAGGPAGAPAMQSKPGVLEIPRPRF